MSRLGSFNRQTRPPSHPEDRRRAYEQSPADSPVANLGYMFGVHRREIPYEQPLPTTTGTGRPPRRRMAMDILNITESPGVLKTLPAPSIGGAELRVPGIPQP